jgi:hypothetical protein
MTAGSKPVGINPLYWINHAVSWAKMQIESGHLPYPAGSKPVGIHPLYWTNHAVSWAKMQIGPVTGCIARAYIIYNIVYSAEIDRLRFIAQSGAFGGKLLFVKTTKKRSRQAPDRAVCADVTKRVMRKGKERKKNGRNPSNITKNDKNMHI